MDLNYLYQRHQISPFMAENGSTKQVRRVHGEFVHLYAARITEAKQAHTAVRAAMQQPTRAEAADELREQAASCRKACAASAD